MPVITLTQYLQCNPVVCHLLQYNIYLQLSLKELGMVLDYTQQDLKQIFFLVTGNQNPLFITIL